MTERGRPIKKDGNPKSEGDSDRMRSGRYCYADRQGHMSPADSLTGTAAASWVT